MYRHTNQKNGDPAPLIADDVYEIIMAVGTVLLFTFLCFAMMVHVIFQHSTGVVTFSQLPPSHRAVERSYRISLHRLVKLLQFS